MRLVGTLVAAIALVAACTGSPGPTGTISGRAVAGPICPVESASPDPACAPRPVAGAVVVVRDGGGREIARATTGTDGSFSVEVPVGSYGVTGEPVEGLMSAPQEPVAVTVTAGATSEPVTLLYDTGIR